MIRTDGTGSTSGEYLIANGRQVWTESAQPAASRDGWCVDLYSAMPLPQGTTAGGHRTRQAVELLQGAGTRALRVGLCPRLFPAPAPGCAGSFPRHCSPRKVSRSPQVQPCSLIALSRCEPSRIRGARPATARAGRARCMDADWELPRCQWRLCGAIRATVDALRSSQAVERPSVDRRRRYVPTRARPIWAADRMTHTLWPRVADAGPRRGEQGTI